MISALNRLKDNTIELTITIPLKDVEDGIKATLIKLSKEVTIKGFRKGKAPIKKVEENIGKGKIIEEATNDIIVKAYIKALEEHNLKPIISPKVAIISKEDKKDWQIKAITCEFPKVDVGSYKEDLKKELAKDSIWTPDKKKAGGQAADNREEKIDKIFKALTKTQEITVPKPLIEDEVNRMLSRLIEQTSKLGMTIEQYLTSIGKNSETLRKEYETQAVETIKLELILSAIADLEKIEAKEEDVKKMINTAPDEETRKKLESPQQQIYIKQLLRKRTVIDNLSKLI
ncbi:MAG: trigger factor [Patescibacteria group bacterium]|nr:hypothetical protein [Patescibacteria group bacterium]